VQEDLAKVLLKFSDDPNDIWCVEDAVKGTAIIGGTGSGKTSGSGRTIALKYLKQGWGGLVLCAKTDEVKLWKKYCKETQRSDDLLIFTKAAVHGKESEFAGQEIVFNPIDYEMRREGDGAGETQNLTNIFMNIYKMGNRITGDTEVREERYWDSALKRCLNRTIELIKLANDDLTYENMAKLVTSCQTVTRRDFIIKADQLENDLLFVEEERSINYCMYCLLKAYEILFKGDKEAPEELDYSYSLVEDYFTKSIPNLNPETAAIVFESFLGLAEPFLDGILKRHFSGTTNLKPEITYTDQKIIVLDFSIKEYLDMGIIGQCVFKQLFQQAIERRDIEKYPMPVFLWCDEAQYFVNPYDQIFLTTARSSKTATVFLSQNLSNYYAVMGAGQSSKAKVDSLMGNLSTKIFHANSDAVTNEYASRLIGQDIEYILNIGEHQRDFSLASTQTQNQNGQYLPQVQPKRFTTLKSGGVNNKLLVESIMVVSGKEWSDKKNYLEVEFEQNFD
jgi:hypothetical protein